MTSSDILRALVGFKTYNTWNPQRVRAVANSYAITGYESDLMIVQPTGWLTEVEIKVSVSDFRAEFEKKERKHRVMQKGFEIIRGVEVPQKVRLYYMAMPKDVYLKVCEEVPKYAGVILCTMNERTRLVVPRKHRSPKVLPSVKVTDEDRLKLLESCYFKYWDHRVQK